MRLRREAGVWELFVPGVGDGARYKYELLGPDGDAAAAQGRPVRAAQRAAPGQRLGRRRARRPYVWSDDAWLAQRAAKQRRDAPIAIYEVHLGSWQRTPSRTTAS